MKYVINTTNFNDFDTIGINKLEGRSFFVPYTSKKSVDSTTLLERRYASEKVACLNGAWDFKFYHNPNDMPVNFDTDKETFDKIQVPGCWQFQGYDRPFYLNTQYQFPFHAPYVPTFEEVGKRYTAFDKQGKIKPHNEYIKDEYNFVGLYRTYIYIKDTNKKHIISFLGVASCLDLYLNGEFVGYSEGSHNIAEFALDKYLKEGQNELVAVIHRWCNGSYLECQDMFRNNGIFRDVLLYEIDSDDVWDYAFTYKYSNDKYTASLIVKTYNNTHVKAQLTGHGLDVTKEGDTNNNIVSLSFEDLDVVEWNCEKPTTYDLYIETKTSVIKAIVGFRRVEIVGEKFLLNNKLIKIKGVNHHDTSYKNGYTMSPEELLKDIEVCKEYNINTIRTSHYPADPLLLDLADAYGIYIIDEADIEAHGCLVSRFPPNFNYLSNNKKWESHYLDRGERMFERDKNHCSIIMWSLGNEAGGYKNQDAMYQYFKSVSLLPVHYESVVHSKRRGYDVGSEMYPSQDRVHSVGIHKHPFKIFNDRPYIMCEYAHAMGVGPGAMEEYWEEIYQYDNIMGGCVWEMVDHAVLEKDGSLTYGGDHNEYSHDGNFCVDGLFYPDRSPSSGAKLVRFTYRPIRVKHLSGKSFEVFNTNAFTNANKYDLIINGKTYNFDINPLEKKVIELDINDEELLNVITIDKNTSKEVSKEQIVLSEKVQARPKITSLPKDFVVKSNGHIAFGNLASSEQYTLLYRARTDNDNGMYSQGINDVVTFYKQDEKVLSVNKDEDRVVVLSTITVGKMQFALMDTYEGVEGGVLVTSKIHTIKGKGFLPRFAKSFVLDSSFDNVSYYGRNGESYIDMKDHTQIEEVNTTVNKMTEPNIKPQESGNRMDTKYVKVSNKEHEVTIEAVNSPFELGIKPYSDKALTSMKHNKDEVRTGTYVTISAFQAGIGTGSCGPSTLTKYRYPMDKDYELSFVIKVK